MTMTAGEAQEMLGTEFIYEYSDGDTIPAYVKAMDLKTGRLSCFSLDDRTRNGWISRGEKVDGAWCVITTHDLPALFRHLEIIRNNGRYRAGQALTREFGLGNGVTCAFQGE